RAGAIYQGQYPLATALGRPLIAQLLVEVATREGASWVAHGSTGKGNDQVRFDVAVGALAPHLKVLAPLRDGMSMTRDQEIEYTRAHGLPIDVKPQSPYSIDENLWGRSIEAGVLEDALLKPPEDAFHWTSSVDTAPASAALIELDFERGVPTAMAGRALAGLPPTRSISRRWPPTRPATSSITRRPSDSSSSSDCRFAPRQGCRAVPRPSRYLKTIAMLLKSAQDRSNAALLNQYWLPACHGSLTRTCVAETPLRVTTCSTSEYRILIFSSNVVQ